MTDHEALCVHIWICPIPWHDKALAYFGAYLTRCLDHGSCPDTDELLFLSKFADRIGASL